MIDKIVNKINTKANNFEEVRKIALDIICEINEKSKYPLELIVERPNLIIQIKDLDKRIKIPPESAKEFAVKRGTTIKEEILNQINNFV